MNSLLNTTMNTRAILTDNLKIIRSDVPHKITETEIGWLTENNITTIIDLREENLQKISWKCLKHFQNSILK